MRGRGPERDSGEGTPRRSAKENARYLAANVIDYLLPNRAHTVYSNPTTYDQSSLSPWARRDNLARGVTDVVEAQMPSTGNRRMLELGAGTGILSMELARRGISTVAVDIAPHALDRLNQKASEANLEGLLSTRVADMNARLPFEDNSFGGVVSLRATRYITDFDAWLGEVYRVLEPNGPLILPAFWIDTLPWKRHSVKGMAQETSTRRMIKAVTNAGFEIDHTASQKYKDAANMESGDREVPFYYTPQFIVAKKPARQ